MKKLLFAVFCASLLGSLGVRSASADTFNFSFNGVDTGSGTLSASPTGTAGVYLITGITGSITSSSFGVTGGMPNTMPITGVIPVGTWPSPSFPLDSNDNLLYFPSVTTSSSYGQPTYLDLNGVSFYVNGTSTCTNLVTDHCFNFYYGSDAGVPTQATTGYNLFYPNGTGNDLLTGFTVTAAVNTAPTPEPGSLILLGTGVTGLAGVLRRRIQKS